MKILCLLTPAVGKGRSDFEPLVIAEEKAVWAAFKADHLRELYFQSDPLTVALVFEAAGTAEVETTLQSFPMIQAGLLDVQLIKLGPWVQFEALFAAEHRS